MSVLERKKVHPVFQVAAAECGAASLCMVLGYYGRYIDLTEMRKDCHISRDGSRLSYLMKAAEKHGLKADAYRKGPELENITLPCIVFWRYYHFLVVEKITDKWVYLADPASGKRRVTKEEFAANFSGVVLQLKPTDALECCGKPYNPFSAMLKVLAKQKAALLYLAVLTLLINIVGLIIPGMTRLFVDYYLPSIGNVNLSTYFFCFFLFLTIQFAMLLIKKHVTLRFQRMESAQITSEVVKKILRLPVGYYQTRSHSAISRRLDSIDQLAEFIAGRFVPISLGLVFSLIYIGLLFYYNFWVGLFCTVVVALVLGLFLFLVSVSMSSAQTASNAQVSFYSSFAQVVKLFDTVKSTSMEDQIFMDTTNRYHTYENALQVSQKTMAVVQAIPVAVPLLMQLIVIGIGSYQTVLGKMTEGEVLACVSVAVSVFSPIAQFIGEYNSLQSRESDMKGLDDIRDEEADRIPEIAGEAAEKDLPGSLELKHVSFGYNTALPPVVKDISFFVPPGGSLALVGSSGSGKSSVLSLIEGFYLPQEGEILIGGVPREKLDRETAAGLMAIVTQKPEVFSGTIRDNITLFDRSISMEEVIRAAEDACVLDEIEAHEGGFQAKISPRASGLSGGQVQRIMIARALLRHPAVLILDEATSALDTLVEEQIMENIRKRGITRIIVAHRLSTIRDSDQIIVLDHGSIVESGTHDRLMQREAGIYRQLIQAGEA